MMVFLSFFCWLQKEINDPFPPFQQQPRTTQPIGSATHLDLKLHSKVLIQFPPWEEIRRRVRQMQGIKKKQTTIPKNPSRKKTGRMTFTSFMFKGKKRCTCLFLFGKIKWLQMDLFFPFPTHPGTKNTLLNMVGTKKSACNLKRFNKKKSDRCQPQYSTVHLRFHDLL